MGDRVKLYVLIDPARLEAFYPGIHFEDWAHRDIMDDHNTFHVSSSLSLLRMYSELPVRTIWFNHCDVSDYEYKKNQQVLKDGFRPDFTIVSLI